uniref:BSD domain-containing protein n=2 Tax=Oryza punctata TaxID=4537 RepID=A0A0E0LP40_ORYPU
MASGMPGGAAAPELSRCQHWPVAVAAGASDVGGQRRPPDVNVDGCRRCAQWSSGWCRASMGSSRRPRGRPLWLLRMRRTREIQNRIPKPTDASVQLNQSNASLVIYPAPQPNAPSLSSDPIQIAMDFFKSILAEPEPGPSSPPPPSPEPEQEHAGSTSTPPADDDDVGGGEGGGGGGWGFGGLLKTLTSQSETVLEAYRRDLAEFGTGLRRETEALRDAAARAARDLPAHAHALDGLADIVAQGKDAIAQVAAAAAAPATGHSDGGESEPNSASGQVRYSRFEAQLRALQSDPATFTSDPEDADDFAAWRLGFSVDERSGEIEALCYESDVLEGMVEKLVPGTVESEVFWARYFYRVHKLKQQEDARAKLVKRVFAAEEDEEDLSWEVDDEDEEEQQRVEEAKEEGSKQEPIEEDVKHVAEDKESGRIVEENEAEAVEESRGLEKEQKNADALQPEVFGSSMVVVDKEEKEETSISNIEESSDKKAVTEEPRSSTGDDAVKDGAKNETSDSSKDSDYSIVSRQRTATEEEDLEWDEIEDLGEHEEKRGSNNDSSPALKEELRKRLSVAEDDEDLSWDIEDD